MEIKNLLPKHYLELEYFDKMFQFLDPEVMKNKTIIVSHDYQTLPMYGKDVVAILTAGDETGKPPKYAKDVGFVFKHHLDHDNIGNVYHMPLPYPNKFCGNAKIPIKDRKHDIFFAGCKRGSRTMFVRELKYFMQKNLHDYKFCVKITGKFGSGYKLQQYCDIMSNSKIILSPRGWVRPECLRFSEAVRCGCMIISEPHPDVTCFNDTPFYPLKQWTSANIAKAVKYCMENQENIYEGMIASWKNHFSPQAMAQKINNVVGGNNVN